MSPSLTPTLSREGRGGTYATVDIGTNAVLLLVAEHRPHPNPLPQGERGRKLLQVMWDEARITRLGESLHKFRLFIPAARKRTLEVLRGYKKICDSFQVREIAAVGTAAFRKAENAGEFIEEVFAETGIRIEILTGYREAELSFRSVREDFGTLPDLIALDIGGGSTEIISEKGGESLDVGAVILTETIVKNDPPTELEYRVLLGVIDGALKFDLSISRIPTLVGLAGSVTTLSAIKQKLEFWNGAKVQGSILTLSDINEMAEIFRRTTHKERRMIPGMVKGREDTILAGTLILKKVMEKLGSDRVIVSDRGLRYGLFYERFSIPS